MQIMTEEPLRAAREWRGLTIVAAARNSGLPLAQAEALESGDSGAFDSVEEMVAAAVLYGATLGIGRDEAMALLDRTVDGEEPGRQAPHGSTDAGGGLPGYVEDVKTHGGTGRGIGSSLPVEDFVMPPAQAPRKDDAPSAPLEHQSATAPPPASSSAPAPAAFPRAPQAPHIDDAAQPPSAHDIGPLEGHPSSPYSAGAGIDGHEMSETVPYETSPYGHRPDPVTHLSLEPADGFGYYHGGAAIARPTRPGRAHRPLWMQRSEQIMQRAFGDERARSIVGGIESARTRARQGYEDARHRLDRSSHATLIVAVVAGTILIVLMMAISALLGGGDTGEGTRAGKEPATQPPAAKKAEKPKAATKARPKARRGPRALIPRSQISLDVLNAGSTSGKANAVAQRVRNLGYTINSVGNSSTRYGTSVILHPPDMRREALRLSRETGVTTLDQVAKSGAKSMAVIVV